MNKIKKKCLKNRSFHRFHLSIFHKKLSKKKDTNILKIYFGEQLISFFKNFIHKSKLKKKTVVMNILLFSRHFCESGLRTPWVNRGTTLWLSQKQRRKYLGGAESTFPAAPCKSHCFTQHEVTTVIHYMPWIKLHTLCKAFLLIKNRGYW